MKRLLLSLIATLVILNVFAQQAELVADIVPGDGAVDEEGIQLTAFDGKGYYGNDGSEFALYEIDGDNINIIKNASGMADLTGARNFQVIGDQLFFSAYDADFADFELHIFDGATLTRVDINPAGNSNPQEFTEYNGDVYFIADHETHGRELWKWNGTEVTLTSELREGNNNPSIHSLTIFDGKLFFSGTDGNSGQELWSYDGTNFTLEADIAEGVLTSQPGNLIVFGNELFMTASTSATGQDLFSYDGSELTSWDFNPGTANGDIGGFYIFDEKLFFLGNGGTGNGGELWAFDGTEFTEYDLREGSGGSGAYQFTEFNGDLFFRATSVVEGYHLFKYDGADFIEILGKDGFEYSSPEELTVYGPYLYFKAYTIIGDDQEVRVAMRSNGEVVELVENDQEVEYLNSGYFRPTDDYMYFMAEDETYGWEPRRIRRTSIENDIVSFSFPEQTSAAAIDADNHTVSIEVWGSANLASLTPEITISDYATIDPEGAQDFSDDFTYTVTSEFGEDQEWIISVSEGITLSATQDVHTAVYPNPVLSSLRVEGEKGMMVSLIDVQGRMIHQEKGDEGELILELESLKRGLYFVKIQSGSSVSMHKILKTN